MVTINKALTNNASQTPAHQPVMWAEAMAALQVKSSGIYVDGTFGCGGHSTLILNRIGSSGRLLVIDLDFDAIKLAQQLRTQDPRLFYYHGSFKEIQTICSNFEITKVDGILIDLGVSSPQLDNPNKGFSFSKEGPLDMRMNKNAGVPASLWLEQVEFNELYRVLKQYGQEKFSKKIAMAIIEFRKKSPIKTTFDLAKIIQRVYPKGHCRHKDPATKTFQAIRIHINQELANLEHALPEFTKLLTRGGRLVVISFHSLEDRIVKNFINKHSKLIVDPVLRKFPEIIQDRKLIDLKNLGKFKPSAQELASNRRARSAIMRVAEKCE